MRYLLEHQDDFPGVDASSRSSCATTRTARSARTCSATSARSARRSSRTARFRGVEQGDRVGKSGIESEYDRFLRGINGASRVQVDALGNLKRTLTRREPRQGRQLRLSIDLDVQQAGQEALASGTGKGAFVVMDINNGEVLALGSAPSFDPNVFAKAITTADYKRLTSEENGEPLVNRAIQGGYPDRLDVQARDRRRRRSRAG